MSKLDFPTILILAICIVAITFLGYKLYEAMTDKADPAAEPTAQIDEEEPLNENEEDTYSYDIDESDTTGIAASDEETAETVGGGDISYTTPEDEEPEEATVPDDFSTDSEGKYLVIAGAFSLRHNAENYASELQDMGYSNASMKIFNGGKLAVVLVDRFESRRDASDLVKELKDKGIDAYLQTKRGAGARAN